MAIILRLDNRTKEQNFLMAFTEENTLLIAMSSPYLFCPGLLSRSENINYLGSKESHTILFPIAASDMFQAGSLQKQ